MAQKDFNEFLTWIKPQGAIILFIGGEPTEHRDLPDMLRLCIENKVKFRIATNCLFDKDNLNILKNCGYATKLIVNYNNRQYYTEHEHQLFYNNLDWMKKITIPFFLYYNIQKTDKITDYDRLIRDALKYNATVALCITIPHTLELDKEADSLIYITNKIKEAGLHCTFFRPPPRCMFTKEQWKNLKWELHKYYKYSICGLGPIIVNPDLSIFPCNSLNSREFRGPSILILS